MGQEAVVFEEVLKRYCIKRYSDAMEGQELTLEPEGLDGEKPTGSGMPGTLDLAGGGERSCATQVGTWVVGVAMMR